MCLAYLLIQSMFFESMELLILDKCKNFIVFTLLLTSSLMLLLILLNFCNRVKTFGMYGLLGNIIQVKSSMYTTGCFILFGSIFLLSQTCLCWIWTYRRTIGNILNDAKEQKGGLLLWYINKYMGYWWTKFTKDHRWSCS